MGEKHILLEKVYREPNVCILQKHLWRPVKEVRLLRVRVAERGTGRQFEGKRIPFFSGSAGALYY